MSRQLQNTVSLSAIAAVLAFSSIAQGGVLPANGHFVSGHGVIGKGAQSLTVKQSSTTGIINWNSFSVGKHQGVTFDNGSGATLNRVTGGNLSTIAGSLHATGSLYLMNNSGVIVSGTGHVVTGGSFVASSGAIASDADKLRVTAGKGVIVNRGSIAAGGNALLSGRGVANEGSITAASIRLRATTGNALDSGTIAASGNAHRGAHVVVISQSGKTRITGDLVAHGHDGAGTIETSGHLVSLSGHIDAGKGGTWLVDPENLTVDAKAARKISHALNRGTNVTLKTTATGTSGPGNPSKGVGDLDIFAPLSWDTSATLTLDAYHSVHFNAAATVAGKGNVHIELNDGGTGGLLRFLTGGTLTFDRLASNLTIDGDHYTLVRDIPTLASDIASNSSGLYALAANYDASAGDSFTTSPIPTTFTGTLTGLGHTISNLQILQSSGTDTGLFADIGSEGEVDYLTLSNVNIEMPKGATGGALAAIMDGTAVGVSVSGEVAGGADAGGLFGTIGVGANVANSASSVRVVALQTNTTEGGIAGTNNGTITGSTASGSVFCTALAACGGLVGINTGAISLSSANSILKGREQTSALGGLVGENSGQIEQSFATGTFTGTALKAITAGLVGVNEEEGVIDASYAVVGDSAGNGLVGGNYGMISNSHASGTLDGGGGLVNTNGGTIDNSYSDVAVSGGFQSGGLVVNNFGTISQSYATGNVSSGQAGGLVSSNSGTISDSHATGTVSSSSGGGGGLVGSNSGVTGAGGLGGLVGLDDGFIAQSYATGNVTGGASSDVGGLVGSVSATQFVTPNISGSFATGDVSGGKGSYVGGAIGLLNGGDVFQTYATGDVESAKSRIGGFVGEMEYGTISQSYAMGDVSGGKSADLGGFVGYLTNSTNSQVSAISDSHANGTVTGLTNAFAGSFAGYAAFGKGIATVSTSYGIGAVTAGASSSIGGFLGYLQVNNAATFTYDYWDTTTTGLNKTLGVGNRTGVAGITGMKTAQLQAGLPTGFDSSVWAEDPSINGGLPYLIALEASY